MAAMNDALRPDLEVILDQLGMDLEPAGEVTRCADWVQEVPSAVWTVRHGLGRRPLVQVVVGDEVVTPASVRHSADSMTCYIAFQTPTAGTARLV